MSDPREESAFPKFLKFWRGVFELSQEELAHRLNCSARHLSRLETEQSRPSAALIRELGKVLELGERDLNHLLLAAGFAPNEKPLDFDVPELHWLRKAMLRTLRALDPYPATLIGAHARILMVNRGFVSLFSRNVPEELLRDLRNNFDFVLGRADEGTDKEDWKNLVSAILMASQQIALFSNRLEDQEAIDRIAADPRIPTDWKRRAAGVEPASSFKVQLDINGTLHDFYNVSTTAGALGPAAFVSEPRLTINILYPEDETLDLAPIMRNDVTHPLLFY